MKNILKIILAFIMLIPGIPGVTQVLQDDVEKSFNTGDLRHPYLLFNHDEKLEIIQEIEQNQGLREIYERQLLEAYRFLKIPEDFYIPPGGDRSRYYADNEMRGYMSRHLEAAIKLAFVYQMTDDPVYAEKAFYHAEMLCRLENWVYPFHEFPEIYDRVWPWNVNDDQVVFSFDLQSARIATHLALVYDWIYQAMDKGQRDRIRGALLEKAITRVRGNYDYHWWASAYRCNWSGICYSGVGLASLALLTEDPQLTDVITHSYNGVSMMLNELGPDGGWQEGRGYWAYGIGHSLWFMDAMKRISSGSYDLFLHPKLKDNPVDFVMYTIPADFSDGRGGPVGDSWSLNKLISETGNTAAAWYLNTYIEQGETLYDLIWPKPDVPGIEPEIKSKHFRGIDWAVMRSSFDDERTFTIACKAGMNDDPHHGHLDCGHFILNYMGENFIREPGKSSYDDFYFSAERWDYIEANSQGHNVIMVEKEEQIPAKLKDQPWKEGIGGKINMFFTSDTMDYVSMINLERAYPGEELHSWQRQIILEKPSVAVILDRVGTDKNAEIRSRLHPSGDIEIYKDFFTINSEKGALSVVPFSSGSLKLETGRQGSISVNQDARFKWLDFVDLLTVSDTEQTHLGFLVFPYPGIPETESIVSSVKITKKGREEALLSFIISGKKYEFPFNKPESK